MLPCHRTKHDQGDCEGMALTLLRTVVESAPLLASTNLQQTVSFYAQVDLELLHFDQLL